VHYNTADADREWSATFPQEGTTVAEMKKRLVRKVAEVGSVPLFLSVLVLNGPRDYEGVVEEVAATRGLFYGVLMSNALCVVLLHTAFTALKF
jgi:hypothetical protein